MVLTARRPERPTLTRAETPGTERLLHLRQYSERAGRGMRTRRFDDIFLASAASLLASSGARAAWRAAEAASLSMRAEASWRSVFLTPGTGQRP